MDTLKTQINALFKSNLRETGESIKHQQHANFLATINLRMTNFLNILLSNRFCCLQQFYMFFLFFIVLWSFFYYLLNIYTYVFIYCSYILYDVNPPEGFNLRRDVYVRIAVFLKRLANGNKEFRWHLVLPPWSNVQQAKTTFFQYFN